MPSSQPPSHTGTPPDVLQERIALDSTASSGLHRLGRILSGKTQSPPSAMPIYLAGVLLTYAPMLIAALLDPVQLAWPIEGLKLPFLYDWNICCMFLVSFPALLVLALTDQSALARTLDTVQRDGVMSVAVTAATTLAKTWRQRFRIVNQVAQLVGIIVGVAAAYVNYVVCTVPGFGSWQAPDGMLRPAGFISIVAVFFFYMLVPIYVIRSTAVSLFLRDLVKHASLSLLPLHPDGCGGLRPIGSLGLRNQYALTVCGLNILLFGVVAVVFLGSPSSVLVLVGVAGASYIVIGPLVFLGPLLPFRTAMLATKAELMSEVARRLRRELARLRQQLPAGDITNRDEELIERLRKIGAMVEELPVWPFDARTLRRFLAAYVSPLLGALGIPLADAVIRAVFKTLQSH